MSAQNRPLINNNILWRISAPLSRTTRGQIDQRRRQDLQRSPGDDLSLHRSKRLLMILFCSAQPHDPFPAPDKWRDRCATLVRRLLRRHGTAVSRVVAIDEPGRHRTKIAAADLGSLLRNGRAPGAWRPATRSRQSALRPRRVARHAGRRRSHPTVLDADPVRPGHVASRRPESNGLLVPLTKHGP